MDVIPDGAETDCGTCNCLSLDEGDFIAGMFHAWIGDVDAVTEGKKMFLSGKVSFCRFGSLGSGDFA